MREARRSTISLTGSGPVKQVFKQRFGHSPAHVLAAPGCVELLGSYAIDNEGLLLSGAIDRHLWLAASPRTDGRIEMVSSSFQAAPRYWLSDLAPDPSQPAWHDPARAVLSLLRKRGTHFTGFSAAIHSGIPMGVGMGSSTALAVATAFMVRHLWPYRLTEIGLTVPPRKDARGRLESMPSRERLHLVRLLVDAEAACGPPGQGVAAALPILFGRGGHLVSVDCRFGSMDLIPFIGEALVIGLPKPMPKSDPKTVAAVGVACRSAARKLRARSLRSVEPIRLRQQAHLLSPCEKACASHAVGEIQRAAFGERAAREDDHNQVGEFMRQSYESGREFLGNSTDDLDALVRLSRAHPACLGSRVMGWGFGGACVSLVRHHEADRFVEAVRICYTRLRGRDVDLLVLNLADRID